MSAEPADRATTKASYGDSGVSSMGGCLGSQGIQNMSPVPGVTLTGPFAPKLVNTSKTCLVDLDIARLW